MKADRAWVGKSLVAYFRPVDVGMTLAFVRPVGSFDRLSQRKREVATMFAHGASQSEVAQRLRLSPSTVNNYLGDVYRELGVTDKGALAIAVAHLEPPAYGSVVGH